jgi:hypothetical protein
MQCTGIGGIGEQISNQGLRPNWNVGMMEYWKNGLWDTGLLGRWSAEGGTANLKMDNIL